MFKLIRRRGTKSNDGLVAHAAKVIGADLEVEIFERAGRNLVCSDLRDEIVFDLVWNVDRHCTRLCGVELVHFGVPSDWANWAESA